MSATHELNDAGLLRERLALELADWNAAGFFSPERAARFHRRARILARLVGMDVDDVIERLREDAADTRERDA